ncbi:Disease resistance RPP8-like protein 3 [Glycine soja]
MADLAVSFIVSAVANNLTGFLVQESARALKSVRSRVEWIAKELRCMLAFIEHLESREGSNPNQLELVEDIRIVALDAQDVMETFQRRRRKGVMYWFCKYKLGRELDKISNRMRQISERIRNSESDQTSIVPTVETPGVRATTIVSPALEKLDHILTQNLIIRDEELIEIVEHVRDDVLVDIKNAVSNLNSTTGELSQRENVWLEEVKEVCDYTVGVAEKFIARREKRLSMGMLCQAIYLFELYASKHEFLKKMKYICTQFEDALYRRWTFFGKDMGAKMGSRSTPVPMQYMPENPEQHDIDSVEGLILNGRQKVWVDQLRSVTRKGHCLVAGGPKDGFLYTINRIRFAWYVEELLREIIDISDRKNNYAIANIQGRKESLLSIQGSQSETIVEHNDTSGTGVNSRAPPAASSYRHITGLKRKFQLITGEKQLMDALSRDVQEIGELEGRSKIWVQQMEDLARETEPVITKCASELEHKSMIICIMRYYRRHVMMDEIKKIRKKIEDASTRKKAYGLGQLQSQAELSLSTVQILRPKKQPSLILNKQPSPIEIVGFDEEVEVLMNQLLSDEKSRCITSIVGIEGTGKTTLASLIFENQVVKDNFDCRVWVSVSPSCTVEQLLQEVAEEAAKQIMGGQQDRWTTQVVFTTLANTKYLIVVDGIKTSHVLDTLRETIPDKSTRSRFLLTTSNANVLQQAGTRSFVLPIQLLDDENSWILFTRILRDVPLEQTDAEKEIVNCGGLPTEILKMSELLLHEDAREQSIIGQNPWSETLNTVCMNLPSYLRRCLFYFKLFPADFGIPVRRLIVLWVAEGLVHQGEDQGPPELIAEKYLAELIDLNMVQIAKRKPNGKVKTCRLPNPFREFLLNAAVPTNSRIRQVADRFDENDTWHRHIHGNTTTSDSASLLTNYKDVLSFLSFDAREGSKPGQDISNFLNLCISSNCLLLLRVLDLEGVYKPKLPKNIGRLTRLRYLGLRWTYLESLPSSISSLLRLQTLDLKYTYIHTLTSSIWKMELRHLFLSETYRTKFPPKPKGIRIGSSVSDLQTLWGLFVDEETPVKGGLDKLVNIRKLGITCQSMSKKQEAMESQLDVVADWIVKLDYLQSLRLKSRDEEGRPWNIHLKSLKNHINLTDVYLLGCLSSPSILNQLPSSLVELTLSHSKLEDDPMQTLKDLPNLHSLSLLAESYLGKDLVCSSQSFPQLHVLKFWKLEQLEEWNIEPEALPSLRQLEIRSCPGMKMLPDGLKHVNTLLELKLTNMPTEINTDKHSIPPKCEVHRDDSQ